MKRLLDWARRFYDWTNTYLQSPALCTATWTLKGTVEKTIWSYNQGVPVGENVLLYKATHDRTYLRRAERIAQAAYAYYVTQGRLFTQPVYFNSIFFKNLLLLESVTGDGKYHQAMADYADELWSTMRDPGTGLVHFDSSGGTEAIEQAAFAQLYAVLAWPRGLWPTLLLTGSRAAVLPVPRAINRAGSTVRWKGESSPLMRSINRRAARRPSSSMSEVTTVTGVGSISASLKSSKPTTAIRACNCWLARRTPSVRKPVVEKIAVGGCGEVSRAWVAAVASSVVPRRRVTTSASSLRCRSAAGPCGIRATGGRSWCRGGDEDRDPAVTVVDEVLRRHASPPSLSTRTTSASAPVAGRSTKTMGTWSWPLTSCRKA